MIRTDVQAHGRVMPNDDRLAHVIPRFPGVVKEVRRRLGDAVTRGETLAVVQSNESLQTYEVPAPIAGRIIAKHVTPGELAREGAVIYTVADLSTVWADLNVVVEDFRRLRVGQTATLESTGGIAEAQGPIVYLSPLGAENTQMLLARVEIANPIGDWKPGLYVSAEIAVEEAQVPVAVEAKALQTFRDWDVVFLTDGTVFQAMPLAIGRRDAAHAEVLSGVTAGQRYAADNSFIVKADVGKSGATHDH
jgi:cobalt-zinc-cadmium efflux system membrane fusion protein